MSLRKLGCERGDGLIEAVLWLTLGVGVLVVAGVVVLWARDQQARKLTPAEQAYVIAVATQRADAYIRAVATQAAAAPRSPVPPAQPVSQAPAPTPPPPPPPPPPVAPAPTPTPVPPPPPPPPPPSPAPTKSPMTMCVGYMAAITSDGLAQCQQIASGPDQAIGTCVADVLAGTATTAQGKADCVQAAMHAGDAYLSDCFLGLSDQSHFGMMSCRAYYKYN